MTVDDIFEKFGTNATLGKAIERDAVRASEMRKRGSIPIQYWMKLVHNAPQFGVDDLLYADLVDAHTPDEFRVKGWKRK